MAEERSFSELLQRWRAGDQQAAANLFARFGTAVRAFIRTRLTDSTLRRRFDSEDVAQSVFRSFFVRAAAGQYALETAEQLREFLLGMARKKLLHRVRRERAACRDYRLADGSPDQHDFVDPAAGPSKQAEDRDLLREVCRRLSEEERRLCELRYQQEYEWADIAAEMDGTPDGLRMRLARALARVAEELEPDPSRAFAND